MKFEIDRKNGEDTVFEPPRHNDANASHKGNVLWCPLCLCGSMIFSAPSAVNRSYLFSTEDDAEEVSWLL